MADGYPSNMRASGDAGGGEAQAPEPPEGAAEELSDLKRRYADLERRCRGLESRLSKTRARMEAYRGRCRAWERALAEADGLYRGLMRDGDPMRARIAYGVAVCASAIRREVAPAYPGADCAELRHKVLNRAPSPEAGETE